MPNNPLNATGLHMPMHFLFHLITKSILHMGYKGVTMCGPQGVSTPLPLWSASSNRTSQTKGDIEGYWPLVMVTRMMETCILTSCTQGSYEQEREPCLFSPLCEKGICLISYHTFPNSFHHVLLLPTEPTSCGNSCTFKALRMLLRSANLGQSLPFLGSCF